MSEPKPVEALAEELFRAKRERRRALAALPVEEKYKILLRLQELAGELAKAAGRPPRKPWPHLSSGD